MIIVTITKGRRRSTVVFSRLRAFLPKVFPPSQSEIARVFHGVRKPRVFRALAEDGVHPSGPPQVAGPGTNVQALSIPVPTAKTRPHAAIGGGALRSCTETNAPGSDGLLFFRIRRGAERTAPAVAG